MSNRNTFILENVRIFTGDEFIDNGYVYVKDGTIEEVKAGSSPDRIQLHAPIRSYSGYSVIPGLIDSHIHALSGNMASIEQSLRFGVTTVCDMHNNPDDNERLKKLAAGPEYKSLYADFKCAGLGALIPGGWPIPVIKKKFSHSGKSDSDLAEYTASWPNLSVPEDAVPFVEQQVKQNGASYIKMFHEVGDTVGMNLPLPSPDLQKAVVDAAHQLGVVAVGHALSYQGTMVLLRAGVDGLTHIFCDEPPSDDYIALMKETGAHCNPTLGLVASQTDEGRELFEWFMEDPLSERLLMSRAAYRPHGLASSQKPKSSIKHARANTRALYKAGVPILAGTDASGTGVGLPYGLGLHMELYALIHHAGLSVADALRSATSIPADRFKFHDRGRIEKGKKADLVLIKTDVAEFLEDRQNRLMPLAAVFRNGTVAAPYERFWNWGTRT
ncbi:hypothetical protein PFICI_12272 [Pestalotiopsis fici W106-1]|uniref:Amidohydrolase-related domain-containing protein n=1 Tax=Pestalotiopsis fici (strain W106-1 / CGMCC3.15140) TaxID=1229662 RepID=W3WN94_PESFW|nr:uncharacterized protein PFICI_12272 [Pestalotiopsis fici W106-1]ETS75328.1 hypothetical protein PFICI_12272 [Pestalotiopsis fici W106-1]